METASTEARFFQMTLGDSHPAELRIRRVQLDTGRENVIVISRRSKALRPEIFRGFSRVELRRGNKALLATLLITDDGLIGPDEIGLAEPAFRRFAETQAAAQQVAELQETLETRKLVDRAKGVLIQGGLTEDEAYHTLQRRARDERLSLRQVAEAVLAGAGKRP